MEKVEELIRRIESLNDPEARAAAVELVQALMDYHGAALDRLMEMVAEEGEAGHRVFDRLARDEMTASLLLLYGLHPVPLEERVVQALDKVRPYLDSHGGSVELLGIEEGVVRLRLEGSCKTCPSSSLTLKHAIEEAIYRAAPDVAAIEAEGVAAQTPVQPSAQPAAPSSNGFVQIARRQTSGVAATSSS